MPHSLFISDLHLSAEQPHSMAAFRQFIATQAPQAEALYILGDLFEYWAGDDDLDDPCHAQIIGDLGSLAAHGTRLYLLHGNRDLLMGTTLAQACHATLLQDPTLIDLYGTPTLLSHGDTLCTDDTEYQHYRAQVHDPGFQQQFLAKPLQERKAYIEQLRTRSRHEKRGKDDAIMDVNDDAVAALLREYRYPRLIHGHTHRPNRHEHRVDGHRCERWVLGDWERNVNALRCDASGIDWETLPA
ncbi:MAG: UDP-2,3-diacylglucosamine diphosphatase [Nitrosomonadales bacterium]|nr:UDP-2,3-diacylglucosamine diphosphatase [Nitrosomonadales bacterium]